MQLADAAEHQAQEINPRPTASTRSRPALTRCPQLGGFRGSGAGAFGADRDQRRRRGAPDDRRHGQHPRPDPGNLQAHQATGRKPAGNRLDRGTDQRDLRADQHPGAERGHPGGLGRRGGPRSAVVADEVQRLAERSSNATKRIESLVQTIQADTNEAVSSMNRRPRKWSRCAPAEDAGTALGEIEKVSADLSNLIEGISASAAQQSACRGHRHHPDDETPSSRSPRRPRRAPARPPNRSATSRSSPPTCVVRSPTSSCRPDGK